MIEQIVLDYLQNELSVPIFFEEKNMDEYIVIGKSGTSKREFINSATFFIQSYSNSKYKAALLNEKVKMAMDHMNVLDEITFSRLNSDYDYTDLNKKKYRYQAVYDIGFF